MNKPFVLLLLISILSYACSGTKKRSISKDNSSDLPYYLAQKPNQSTPSKEKNTTFDLNNKTQEDVDFDDDYRVVLDYSFMLSDTEAPILEQIIHTALSKLGSRYRAGGTTNAGFDCSGLVYSSFKKYDITLPRSSYDMANKIPSIKDSEIKRGDLIFFATGRSKRINHVGIVTEILRDEIKFIHSSIKLGVIISSTKEPYYKKSYIKTARVF